jgi:hypothetical protein
LGAAAALFADCLYSDRVSLLSCSDQALVAFLLVDHSDLGIAVFLFVDYHDPGMAYLVLKYFYQFACLYFVLQLHDWYYYSCQ